MKEGFFPGDRSPGGTDDTMAAEIGLEGFNLGDLRPFEPIELEQASTPKSLLLNQYHNVLQRRVLIIQEMSTDTHKVVDGIYVLERHYST